MLFKSRMDRNHLFSQGYPKKNLSDNIYFEIIFLALYNKISFFTIWGAKEFDFKKEIYQSRVILESNTQHAVMNVR